MVILQGWHCEGLEGAYSTASRGSLEDFAAENGFEKTQLYLDWASPRILIRWIECIARDGKTSIAMAHWLKELAGSHVPTIRAGRASDSIPWLNHVQNDHVSEPFEKTALQMQDRIGRERS